MLRADPANKDFKLPCDIFLQNAADDQGGRRTERRRAYHGEKARGARRITQRRSKSPQVCMHWPIKRRKIAAQPAQAPAKGAER